jgi:hypothetical protein
MIVAIHQPNYAPWLGYFYKVARADLFVFLDDAQYSKNGYINRVQIDGAGTPRWLTVPVRYAFGDPINRVRFALNTWQRTHLDTLKGYYRKASAFRNVWSRIEALYSDFSSGDLAASNAAMIEALAGELGLARNFRRASAIAGTDGVGDVRLASLVKSIAPGGVYLSGRGGARYQADATFATAGIELCYTDFIHPIYDQGHDGFLPGLSVLDAVFRLGWSGTAELIAASRSAT